MIWNSFSCIVTLTPGFRGLTGIHYFPVDRIKIVTLLIKRKFNNKVKKYLKVCMYQLTDLKVRSLINTFVI